MSNNTHVIDHPHQDDESDGTESFYSYVKDDSLNTDVAEALLINTSAKRRKTEKKMENSKEQKSNRKESNRQSAQRSRKRQKMLEISLEERIAKLQGDKSNLETRFKNGIKEIFKLWPLPDHIPEEFSSLGPLLNLIDQHKRSSTSSISMLLQNAQLFLNQLRYPDIGNNPVINTKARMNSQDYSPSQLMELISIINNQQSSIGAMDSSSLTNSGMLQRYNQQCLGSIGFHSYNQEENVLHPNENNLSLQLHSTLTHPILRGASNSILSTGSEFSFQSSP